MTGRSDDAPPRPSLPDRGGESDSEMGGARIVSDDQRCGNCAHQNVCAVYQGVLPMLGQWPTGEPPIDPDELAVICEMYAPVGEAD